MTKEKLIPELRFPQFGIDDQWVEKSIGSVTKVSAGGTPTSTEPKYWGGNIPWMNSGELNLKRIYSVENHITELGLKESSTRKIPPFCVLIGLAGQGKTRGTAAINYIEICTNQSIAAIHPNKIKFDSEFLYHKIDSMYKTLRRLSTGQGGRGGLNLSIIREIKIAFPSIQEQKKIAACLSSLDEVILAHNDKLEALKDHKKGLLQNLFPSATGGERSRTPNYRFPEFEKDGEWVEETLGNYLTNKPEYGMNAPAVPYSEKLPTYLRITDISEDGNFLSEGKVSVGQEVTKNDYLTEGDIVLARTGASVGKSYKYKKKDGELVFAGFLIRVKPNPKKLDSEFLFQFLSTSSYWDWVRAVSARSGQPGINGTQYSNMPIVLPPGQNEQEKIASCLSAVDELITAQAEKIEQLQAHKKGLMQGLFPSAKD